MTIDSYAKIMESYEELQRIETEDNSEYHDTAVSALYLWLNHYSDEIVSECFDALKK